MRAGVSIKDLSPAKGVNLGGYPYFDRRNTGIHDPLHVAALYLQGDDGNSILLLASDLFYLTRRQSDALRTMVQKRTGHPAERVLITCSHTHSAPWMSVMFETFPGEPDFDTGVDEDYIAFALERCCEAADEALSGAFSAQIAFDDAVCGQEEGIGGNRRDPKNGPSDPDLPLMVIRDAAGRVRAIQTKYALHPTILHGENTLVSADYPGAMRRYLKERFPEAVFLFSLGTAGDQSPRYYRRGQSFEEVDRFGFTLGRALEKSVKELSYTDTLYLSYLSEDTELVQKVFPAPEEALAKAQAYKEREAALLAQGAAYTQTQTANLWSLGAECEYRNAVRQASGRLRQMYLESAPYTVHALVLNEYAQVFLPGEVFSDFGLRIKAASPFRRTQVITMSNGDLPGYAVTHEALVEGGYEPGNTTLDPVSGDRMVSAALDLLAQIHSKERKVRP